MGENELAIQWLEKAYEAHEIEMVWLKVEPSFKSLYGDPRYQDLLRKVGFPA